MSLKTYQSLHRQKGIGYIGLCMVLAVSVFVGLFAIKVGPHYLENWTVTKVVDELVADPDLLNQSRSKVYAYLNQAYRTNNLWELQPEDSIELERDKDKGFKVAVRYERRANLFHNIDVVTAFDKNAN